MLMENLKKWADEETDRFLICSELILYLFWYRVIMYLKFLFYVNCLTLS